MRSFRQPRYILDLGSCDDRQVRLGEAGEITDFAFLSYCWGQSSDYKTTSTNLQHHLVGFPPRYHPRTIRNAVEAALTLDLQYLWVDALCILQDPDDQMIQNEVKIAHEFHTRAAVVIGAASASHGNAGFLAPRDLPYHEYELPFAMKDGDKTSDHRLMSTERGFEKKPEPMYNMGWTFPEARARCVSCASSLNE
ncbi:heterokaryon incompatibility protein [Colletotrichum tamarilloi]|uniref:Heterokaryon incompatibility protein n=1 Tax=Colletotrichum tamarilloi TaxID=1209934 RepID=A0ABQ9RM61_9PEZI|nr:heterokaryon incompatibility protein [Colletotrichum tamarilloi]KAK1507582.1 heterokaryon incompatibility protein [Colletotrichum tamarilloi]